MVFNDSTNNQGIIQMIDFLCNTDSTSYPLAEKTRNVNNWYRTVNVWIWSVCGDWNYDDSNYETLPVAINDLIKDQEDYPLPTNYLKIERVEILDSNSKWNKLEPITKEMLGSISINEYFKNSATPLKYMLLANSIRLFPPSDSDRDDAIRLYLARDSSIFTTSDTTKSPGFNISFHPILAYGPAFDYVLSIGQVDKIRIFKEMINEYEARIKEYYAIRNTEMRPKIIPRRESYN